MKFIRPLAMLLLLSSPVDAQENQSLRETLTQMFSAGELRLADPEVRLLDLDVPPMLLGANYRTDSADTFLYGKYNRAPQRDVVNVYYLTLAQLDRIGHAELDTCVAEYIEGMRYIFCNAISLFAASKSFGAALAADASTNAELVLARIILGHEFAHHFLNHPTLDPKAFVRRSTKREFERQADVSAAIMLAESPLRREFLNRVFEDASPTAAASISDYLLDYLTTGGRAYDQWEDRLRSIGTAAAEMYADMAAYRGLEPLVDGLPLACISDCDSKSIPPGLDDLLIVWLSSSAADRALISGFVLQNEARIVEKSEFYTGVMLCQAAVFERKPNSCPANIASLITSPLNVLSNMPPLEVTLIAQTALLMDAERFRDKVQPLVLSLVLDAISPMYTAYYGDSQLPFEKVAYGYLSFLNGQVPFVDCGASGVGLRSDPEYSCALVGDEIKAAISEKNNDPLLLINLGLALSFDIARFEHQNALTDLAAVALTDLSSLSYVPAWLETLSVLQAAPSTDATSYVDLTLSFLYRDIGLAPLANNSNDRLASALEADTSNPSYQMQIRIEIGLDCLDNYSTKCAEEHLSWVRKWAMRQVDAEGASEILDIIIDRVDFEMARVHILRGETAEARTLLQPMLSDPLDQSGQISVLEVLAEADIMDCKGREASEHMAEVLQRLNGLGEDRPFERVYATLTYLIASSFIDKRKQDTRKWLESADKLFSENFAFSMIGANPMVAMCHGFTPIANIEAWAKG